MELGVRGEEEEEEDKKCAHSRERRREMAAPRECPVKKKESRGCKSL